MIVFRRLGTEQIAHEVVPGAPDKIRLGAEGMRSVRHVDQVEFLIGGDQRIHHLCRNGWKCIFIQIAIREQQLALQPVCLARQVHIAPIDRKIRAVSGARFGKFR